MSKYLLEAPDWLGLDKHIFATSKSDAFYTYIKVLKINLDEWADEVTEDGLGDFITKEEV